MTLASNIPFLKSKQDMDFYLEYGPSFGKILAKCKDLIKSSQLRTPDEVRQFLIQNSNVLLLGKINEVTFPFKNQENYFGDKFPYECCISINNTAGHGVPSNRHYNFKDTDVISIDFGLKLNNRLYFDGAFTVSKKPEEWMFSPLKAIKNIAKTDPKTTLNISRIIQHTATEEKVDIVASIAGHGIGRALHEAPRIHNAIGDFVSFDLMSGLCFCVEPLYVKQELIWPSRTSELIKTYIDPDGWSIKTANGQSASHFETMFIIYEKELVDILSLSKWEL